MYNSNNLLGLTLSFDGSLTGPTYTSTSRNTYVPNVLGVHFGAGLTGPSYQYDANGAVSAVNGPIILSPCIDNSTI